MPAEYNQTNEILRFSIKNRREVIFQTSLNPCRKKPASHWASMNRLLLPILLAVMEANYSHAAEVIDCLINDVNGEDECFHLPGGIIVFREDKADANFGVLRREKSPDGW